MYALSSQVQKLRETKWKGRSALFAAQAPAPAGGAAVAQHEMTHPNLQTVSETTGSPYSEMTRCTLLSTRALVVPVICRKDADLGCLERQFAIIAKQDLLPAKPCCPVPSAALAPRYSRKLSTNQKDSLHSGVHTHTRDCESQAECFFSFVPRGCSFRSHLHSGFLHPVGGCEHDLLPRHLSTDVDND
eukprot:6236832-Amphidinium_carterae.1